MRALELSDLDFAPVRSGGGSKPPFPPRPVKLGGGGDQPEANRSPVKLVESRPAIVKPAAVQPAADVSHAMRAELDAMVAAMVAAGDVRLDHDSGEYVSTGVRWRFPD